MFKQKRFSFHIHSGIYQFQIPFYTASLVPEKDGIVPVKYCDVEMHIGSEKDEGIATIIISTKKEYQSPTSFILDVVSVIYDKYIPLSITGVNSHEFIRWVQRESYPSERFNELIVKYDSKGNIQDVGFGGYLEKDDWIMTDHKLPKY